MPSSTNLTMMRRFSAELLAYVVTKQFPNVMLAGGGTTKIGFYYDFVFEQKLPVDFLSFIEMHLKTLIKEDLPIRFANMMRENAESFFLHHHQPILADIALEQELNVIDLLQLNDFSGICPAIPVESTNQAGHVKLFDMQTMEMEYSQETYPITRIIGTSFAYFADLKRFSKQYEYYLKKRDHRLLGKELNLFSQNNLISEIEWNWHPKGLCLRNLLQNWVESQSRFFNYESIATPSLIKKTHKKKSRFSGYTVEIDEGSYELSSSRLSQHLALFNTFIQSKELLPVRLIEYGTEFRVYPKAELFGLLCADSVWTDQRTIACSRELLIKELISSLHFIEQIIRMFGFEAHWCLVTSIRKSAKDRAEKEAVEWLEKAVQQSSLFYPFQAERFEEEELIGPRLELRIIDDLQREWACSTVAIVVHERKALDFLKHQGQNENDFKNLVMISKSLWGSLDRLIALLIERHEGELPTWLAPEQVRFLAISEKGHPFVKEIAKRCQLQGIRVKLDLRDVKLGQKIHDVRKEKVPYTVIVGEQEIKRNQLTVQSIKRPEKSEVLDLDDFIELILRETNSPSLSIEIN
jgi:threonyl-tRNA synthetase